MQLIYLKLLLAVFQFILIYFSKSIILILYYLNKFKEPPFIMNITSISLSSLKKIFADENLDRTEYTKATSLKGEKFNFQISYLFKSTLEENLNFVWTKVQVKSNLKENIKTYAVLDVPVRVPHWINQDDYFMKTTPGLYPDILKTLNDDKFKIVNDQCRTLWFEVDVPEDAVAGEEIIEVSLLNDKDEILTTKTFTLEIINAISPEQELICTHWFHQDCLLTHHNLEVFSDKYWEVFETYLKNYCEYGNNMILTPIFTPALDTFVGGERPTVQLVAMDKNGDDYTFHYENFDKFVAICQNHGIKYFEMAHLFTQWGAKFTPKIITTSGERIFGWDVSATDPSYVNFVGQFLPSLKSHLKDLGIFDETYFHISDEPTKEHLESYTSAKNVVDELLSDCKKMDALSDYEYYENGLVQTPIPGNNQIAPFIEHGVDPLWVYYCCSQGVDYVSNRFISMPSARNRILGLQLYKYNIQGFLHWGYNYWYSQYSVEEINPYFSTDSLEGFPSGDPFLVYPERDGTFNISIRQAVFLEALQDLRALKLLEKYMSHEEIISWIESFSCGEITFTNYPHGGKYILHMRDEINNKIKEFVS